MNFANPVSRWVNIDFDKLEIFINIVYEVIMFYAASATWKYDFLFCWTAVTLTKFKSN